MTTQGMRIYGDLRSGNCLKVKYTADYLGLEYTWVDVDIMQGESRTAAFLAHNPQGQVPAVVFDDGRALAQSNAIIRYLARGTTLEPADPFEQAKVDEWLFWEQYSHEPYVAVCRFHMLYLGRSRAMREAWRVERADNALVYLDGVLEERVWLVGAAMSVADVALLPYTRLAGEGGFDLTPLVSLRTWIARCEQALNLPAVTS